jgi:hypothetical protein
MLPYSLSTLILDEEELIQLNNFDITKNFIECEKIRTTKCKTFLGYNCTIEFIKYFLSIQDKNIKYIFVGFNNSNFDNIILINELLTPSIEYDIKIENIFYCNGGILNACLMFKHKFFDIKKHLTGSLKQCCKNFKINCCMKQDFDHNFTQQLYNDNKDKLIDYIHENTKLVEYNEMDVMATAVLFIKYKLVLKDIPILKDIQLQNKMTIGSLIYSVFKHHILEKQIELPQIPYNYYKDLLKYKIAGRVELFNGVQKIEKKVVSKDACSLYPYVMSIYDNAYYPNCSNITMKDIYMGDDTIGFYYCDIDQSNLKAQNLPLIYAEKTETANIWNTKKILNRYLISNVMIRLLLNNKCLVKIYNGFYFEQKTEGYNTFGFLLDFMKIKNEQDELNEAKDDAYNPSLREAVKLLMNAISGKVIEGLHIDKTALITSYLQYYKIKDKASSINCIDTIGNRTIINYTVSEEDIIDKQRPVYLGVLIYDYAKEYMYNYTYKKIGLMNCLYTDTDAIKMTAETSEIWVNNIIKNNILVPHWKMIEEIDPRYKKHLIYEPNSKIFGSFENEFKHYKSDCNEYVLYLLQKKSWGYFYKLNNIWMSSHPIKKDILTYRFKGLNGRGLIIDDNDDILVIKNNKRILNPKYSELDIYNYFLLNDKNKIENNPLKFFETIYKDKKINILVNNFKRITGNNKKNVGYFDDERKNKELNNIKSVFILKQIKLNDLE